MAELAFFRRGEELLRVPLSDRTTIGRGPECDVLLPDPAVSRIVVEPAVAAWGEPIRVEISIDEQAAIPFAGTWAVPLRAEFLTRSEVTR